MIECQKSETLKTYLNNKKSEVFDMLALEFDIDKLKAASYEDGIEDGCEEMIRAFFQSGVSIEQIAKAVKLPKEKILQIIEEK